MDVIFNRNFRLVGKQGWKKNVEGVGAEMEIILTGKKITRENDGKNLAARVSPAVVSCRANNPPLMTKQRRYIDDS